MKLLIISGLSGSGKSIALKMLEDMDYFCIDNIPVKLLRSFVSETLQSGNQLYEQVAVGLDARNRQADMQTVIRLVDELRHQGLDCELVYLHADDGVLLKRYNETRHRHPLSRGGLSLEDAIAEERRLLEPVTLAADFIIDTTDTSVHDLREIIKEHILGVEQNTLTLQFESFGYKNKVPSNADFVFDVRCLPNPYWEPNLRHLTGKDAAIAEYLEGFDSVKDMLSHIINFLDRWLIEFEKTNRGYLTVAVGCTGGRHRSVYICEKLGHHFAKTFGRVIVRHNTLA